MKRQVLTEKQMLNIREIQNPIQSLLHTMVVTKGTDLDDRYDFALDTLIEEFGNPQTCGKAPKKEEVIKMKKLTKAQVKALIRKGEIITVGFLPCKMAVKNPWVSPMLITLRSLEDFEKAINSYTYYNCNNQVGTYPSYYLMESI